MPLLVITKQCRRPDPSRLWLFNDHRLGREEPNMMIIGVDYHPSFQQIAFLIEETGEYDEKRLNHEGGEAERFYRDLKRKGIRVRVGMEATGYSVCSWQADRHVCGDDSD